MSDLLVNVHHPEVKKVERLSTGTICLELGTGEGGTVDVFLTDEGLNQLIDSLLKFRWWLLTGRDPEDLVESGEMVQ